MAVQNDYVTGTITLTSGSADFTSTGAALQSAGIRAGDEILLPAKGLVLVIASITGENAGTLVANCPAGAAGAAQPMRIRFQPDGSRYTAAARALVELLADGKLASLAGQNGSADKLAYLTGATTFGLTTLTAAARSLLDGGDAATMRATLGLGSAATKTAPAATTDNAIARYDGSAGNLQNSGAIVADDGSVVAGRFESITKVAIADDAAMSWDVLSTVGVNSHLGLIFDAVTTVSSFFRVNTSTNTIASWQTASSNIDFVTGVLTGTTGADGRFTLSMSGGRLYAENRLGSTRFVGFAFLV
jgi:hypothetical protein